MNLCIWSAHINDHGTVVISYNLFHAYDGALEQYKDDLLVWGKPDGVWVQTTKTGTYFLAAWKKTTVAAIYRDFKELEARMDVLFPLPYNGAQA